MAPIIANVFRVAINWEGPNSATAENVIHIGSAGTPADVAESVVDAINSNMWQCVSDTHEIAGLSITPLDGPASLTSDFPVPDTGDFRGQGSGDYMPNCCALVKHTTATGGRSGRGRTYLPALPESRQSNGIVAGAQRALTTTGWSDFQTALQAWVPASAFVVASYTNGTVAFITASACEVSIATQRRRLVR